MPLPSLLALLLLGGEDQTAPRFVPANPLPTVPGVMVDRMTTGVGLAEETAKAKNLQARIMWIDATANLDRYNTEEKIVGLVKQIASVGFNTIVFDVKPISGQVVYKSHLAPKLTEWRGKTMAADFDPLPIMVREGHANGLTVLASLNAFSEGHRLFNIGPGYNRPTLQTVLYEPKPVLRVRDQSTPLAPTVDKLPAGGVGVVSTPPIGGYYAVVRKDGLVLEVNAASPPPVVPPSPNSTGQLDTAAPKPQKLPAIAVPKGGSILGGTGDGATWIQNNVRPGDRLQFDTEAEFVPIRERPEQQYPLMMNPLHPQVQQYALEIVREVVSNYEVDGILYDDRLRYGGMNADFSEYTRGQFEEKMRRKVTWPDDVFKWTLTPQMTRGMRPGPLYDEWMAFRAEAIQSYVRNVRHAIKSIRPTCQFGVYAGSWYGDYPALGHNYASPKTDAGFWFLSPKYLQSGTAPMLDMLIAGCYYPTATIFDAMTKGAGIGATVEASGTLVNRLVRDETWSYAGIALSDFKDDPEGLTNALQAACASTQGVMVFDLSHDVEPMWPVFAQAFSQRRDAPHAHPEVLAEIRRRRAALDRLGVKDPPIVIAAGSSGTGQ
jgi:uncharacterized lipoprotein YddW (UPF0748 family)